ncbi:MAG: hypothetical protein R3279_05885 [Putridiphycobacter sp.]|nr:hypothetical protein [Putridiphycobacter sp.]
MQLIKIGNIELHFDLENTKAFYETQNGFSCTCPDCLNYVSKLGTVKKLINGLDEQLGIDLSKDVGQAMDELMPLDYEDHNLYVIPYYINGKCILAGKDLEKQQNGPIWPNTIRADYRLDKNLNLLFINTTDSVVFENAQNVLTIWLEFKTPLLEEENTCWKKIKKVFKNKKRLANKELSLIKV